MKKISRLLKRLLHKGKSSQDYLSYLRVQKKIEIGEHSKIFSPANTHIDTQRPHMLHIGDYVKITKGVVILCHDFSRSVCANMSGYTNIGEARQTWIGDNVFIGINSIILMGAHIGDNSIVGAGSVVSGRFPNGVVIAGNPAKTICTIDEYYQKRKRDELNAAKQYVQLWREKYGKNPEINEMTNAFAWLYLPHTKETLDTHRHLFELSGTDQKILEENFLNSNPLYESFSDFLSDCSEKES